MDKVQISPITAPDAPNLTSEENAVSQIHVFRRPDPRDEIDRLGQQLVRRMMEAGVVEQR